MGVFGGWSEVSRVTLIQGDCCYGHFTSPLVINLFYQTYHLRDKLLEWPQQRTQAFGVLYLASPHVEQNAKNNL
jgi:hypothetical protein